MKKIFSFFMLIVFTISFAGNSISYANQDLIESKQLTKMIVSKSELNKTYKGKQYVNSIDKIVKKYSNDKKNLEKIISRTNKALGKDISNAQVKNILIYLNTKAYIQLNKILEEEKKLVLIEENISESDKKFIEDKITNIQLNALEKASSNIKVLLEKFEDLTNVEESGNLEMNLNIDHEDFGKLEGKVNINDYSSKASGFDSEFKGNIETFFNADLKGEENKKLHFKSMLDLISKDGDIYVLLQNLDIIDEKGIEDFKDILENIKNIAEKNQYIKIENPESKELYSVLNSFNPDKFVKDSKEALAKPLVSAYKKEGNKYFLKPTKYACDKFKELANKFDPFNPNECSKSQYEDLLMSVAEMGSFYAEVDNNKTKIVFEGNSNIGLEKNTGFLSFKYNQIDEFRYTLQNKDNLAFINFKDGEKFNIIIKETGNEAKNHILFYSELNDNNKFKKIDFDVNMDTLYQNLNGKIKLENRNIDGKIEYINKYYDWETGKHIKDYKNILDISGKQDYTNSLEKLEIKLSGTNLENNKENLKGLFKLDNKFLELNIDYLNIEDGRKIKLTSTGKLDYENILDNMDFLFLVENQSAEYTDEGIYKVDYNSKFKKNIQVKININNKIIDGETLVYGNENDLLFKMTNTGNYSKETFKLENNIKLYKELIQFFVPETDEIEINYNLDFDFNNTKNNGEIFINLLFGEKEVGSFKIKNIGNRIYKKIEIKKPENSTSFEEIIK